MGLSGCDRIVWSWKSSGNYLQIKFCAEESFAFWDTNSLAENVWQTEKVFKEDFHYLGGFKEEDWKRITKIAFRIADVLDGYKDGGYTYRLQFDDLKAVKKGEAKISSEELVKLKVVKRVNLREDAESITVGSEVYQVKIGKNRFTFDLSIDGDRDGKFDKVNLNSLYWGYDAPEGGKPTFNLKPMHQTLEKKENKVVLTFGFDFQVKPPIYLILTFYFFGDRFYAVTHYHCFLDLLPTNTRASLSGDVTKNFFTHYAFRDAKGRLHYGEVVDFSPRAGIGKEKSGWEKRGDRVSELFSEKPYLLFYNRKAKSGLGIVYLDYKERWENQVQESYLCLWMQERDHFHLGISNLGDAKKDWVSCFYIDTSGDYKLMDGYITEEILKGARDLNLKAVKPAGFELKMPEKREILPENIYYTFGNHMHWIGVGWGPEGDKVIPTSTKDSLKLFEETGAKGAINFDLAGLERAGKTNPEAIAKLKKYIKEGKIELVGASYGQLARKFRVSLSGAGKYHYVEFEEPKR